MDILLEFPLAGSFRFLLPFHTRLLVMSAFLHFGQDAVFGDGFLESAKSSIDCLILTNFGFRHVFSLPPTMHSKEHMCIKLYYM
jgi:hypothetical protein